MAEVVEPPGNPSVDEVQQENHYRPDVPVCVYGPVHVHQLPARHGVAFTEVYSDTTYHKVFGGPDEKRKRVVITCDGDVFVSFTGASGSGCRIHGAAAIQGQLEVTYWGPIYVAAVTGTVNVGYLAEYWAD